MNFIIGIASSLVAAAIFAAFQYRHCIIPCFICFVCHRSQDIRVSMAGLLLVCRGDEYLLIRDYHRPEQVGPIGGVYKYYPSAETHLKHCSFRPQHPKSCADHDTDFDLRGFLLGKDFPCFIRWFVSMREREIEPLTRELIEELQEIRLDQLAGTVKHLELELVKTIHHGPRRVPGAHYFQFRWFNIYQFAGDDEATRDLTAALFDAAQNNPDLIVVTADDIRHRRSKNGQLIAAHSGYLIGQCEVGPETAPYR